MTLQRKLKFGQIGGGRGSFIGRVHRRAAQADGQTELVAGAFSSTPEKAKASGRDLLIADSRNYGSWQEMLDNEVSLLIGERIDFVNIVTPNHMHFEPALAFVEAGFHVIMDKPMVHTSAQAEALATAVHNHNVIFALTHNYTGYPMVKEGREWIRNGRLGQIQRVVVEYPQGWLRRRVEIEGADQSHIWRLNPAISGIGGAVGDIGSHCENLMTTMTGLELEAICADLSTFISPHGLDDDASILLRFTNGAKGLLYCSQIATAEENNLNIRIYGTKGALAWHQEHPNQLTFKDPNGPAKTFKRGHDYLSGFAKNATHLPPGHPESFFDAFSNVFKNFTSTVRARLEGREPTAQALDFPTVEDGARGVKFIEKVIESGNSEKKWVEFK
ncbi:MAG: Gfo/Idh/MocA family oxidoreductase [Chloroflexota bacterium]